MLRYDPMSYVGARTTPDGVAEIEARPAAHAAKEVADRLPECSVTNAEVASMMATGGYARQQLSILGRRLTDLALFESQIMACGVSGDRLTSVCSIRSGKLLPRRHLS